MTIMALFQVAIQQVIPSLESPHQDLYEKGTFDSVPDPYLKLHDGFSPCTFYARKGPKVPKNSK